MAPITPSSHPTPAICNLVLDLIGNIFGETQKTKNRTSYKYTPGYIPKTNKQTKPNKPKKQKYKNTNPKPLIRKDTRTPEFTAALFTVAKTWKQSKFPSTVEWIKMWYT